MRMRCDGRPGLAAAVLLSAVALAGCPREVGPVRVAPAAAAAPDGGVRATPSEGWRVTVRLVPQAEVVGRGATRVSFGLPLPPGLLQDAAAVRVLEGEVEVAAHVRSLGAWHAVPPKELLCAGLPPPVAPGVRSALVQLDVSFTSAEPVERTVEIGVRRTAPGLDEVPVRDTWRLAAEGTYRPEHGIHEPRVYALLPPRWLACSNLTTLASPLGAHAELARADEGQKQFFDTVLNAPAANPEGVAEEERVDYLADNDPWLYDRAQTFYNGYVRSGELAFAREAHRAAQHYLDLLYTAADCPGREACVGFFRLKNTDPGASYLDSKYSYNESLATLYWLTGDPRPRARLSDVSRASRKEVGLTKVVDELGEWFTERHVAFAMQSLLFEYEVTGDAALAKELTEAVSALVENQSRPFPPGSDNPVNGCWNHDLELTGKIGFSPWKMSLLAHALLRTYHTLADARVPRMLVEAARCVHDRALYVPTGPREPRQLMPRPEAWSLGPPASADGDAWTDNEHALDIAYLMALGAFFSHDPAQKQTFLADVRALLRTHAYTLDEWTRPGGWPANRRALHRVSPPRKYGWWYKNAGAIGWVLGGPTDLVTPAETSSRGPEGEDRSPSGR